LHRSVAEDVKASPEGSVADAYKEEATERTLAVRPRTLIAASAVTLVMLAGSQPAHAQTLDDSVVPFDCVANGRAFTTGQYILVSNDTRNLPTLEARDPKEDVGSLPVETQIAAHKPLAQPEIVFETLNGQCYVSDCSFRAPTATCHGSRRPSTRTNR
jgi:hypothetical protein